MAELGLGQRALWGVLLDLAALPPLVLKPVGRPFPTTPTLELRAPASPFPKATTTPSVPAMGSLFTLQAGLKLPLYLTSGQMTLGKLFP